MDILNGILASGLRKIILCFGTGRSVHLLQPLHFITPFLKVVVIDSSTFLL